ncbi:Crp/Fnr family transcriptional regulator [Helicobacter sp. 13S00401-1]|uniref:Crp/Fnr family transcriptional regulator n=1 Tax=Helicobacter sp. 13S00401-1 TaxID=1905758 RepID=UPI000BA6ECE5|nr:Crp/Fnr family transcriptional regulator [Helicobacter sp. 13S00401-1]
MLDKKLLKSIDIFRSLDDSLLNELLLISNIVQYKKDNVLFYEGERPSRLYILLDGKIKLFKVDNNSNEIVLHRLQGISLIAEVVYFAHGIFPATAIFEGDSTVLSIDYEGFEKFLDNKQVLKSFVISLTEKIRILEGIISNKMILKAKQKIARYIILNEARLNMLNQKQIAKELFITPETLNRNLKILKEEGAINMVKSKIEILDLEFLKDISES